MLISMLTYSAACAILLSVEQQHPLAPGKGQTMKSITPDLPPASGYSDQPQGEVCPPVQTGVAASFKTCSRCGLTLPATLEHFRKDSCRPTGLTYFCKTCMAARDRKAYAKNPEAHRQRAANKRASNPHKEAERHRSYYARNPDLLKARWARYYAANKEKQAANMRRWLENNRESKRALGQKRRARLKAAPGWDYTTADHVAARWAMYGNKCWMCGQSATQTDHVIPLSLGGSHWPSNLRPICGQCNRKKGDRKA